MRELIWPWVIIVDYMTEAAFRITNCRKKYQQGGSPRTYDRLKGSYILGGYDWHEGKLYEGTLIVGQLISGPKHCRNFLVAWASKSRWVRFTIWYFRVIKLVLLELYQKRQCWWWRAVVLTPTLASNIHAAELEWSCLTLLQLRVGTRKDKKECSNLADYYETPRKELQCSELDWLNSLIKVEDDFTADIQQKTALLQWVTISASKKCSFCTFTSLIIKRLHPDVA